MTMTNSRPLTELTEARCLAEGVSVTISNVMSNADTTCTCANPDVLMHSDCRVHREQIGAWSLPAKGTEARAEMDWRDESDRARSFAANRVHVLEQSLAAARRECDELGAKLSAVLSTVPGDSETARLAAFTKLRLENDALRAMIAPPPADPNRELMTDDYYDE